MDERKIALAAKSTPDRETPDRGTPVSEVCEALGISGATLYRYLRPTAGRDDGVGQ